MRSVIDVMQMAFAAMGGAIGAVLGGWDGFLYALVLFVVVDYISGVLVGCSRELKSEIEFRGIARKVVIFFCLSNEGISILENAAALGLPVPKKLRDVLEQLRDDESETDVDDEKGCDV